MRRFMGLIISAALLAGSGGAALAQQSTSSIGDCIIRDFWISQLKCSDLE